MSAGGRMTNEERAVAIEKAIALHAKRKNWTEIGEAIGVSRKTAAKLVRDGYAMRAEHRERSEAREESIATYQQIVSEGWERLATMDNRSLNVSGILNSIRQAQSSIDELLGIKAPIKYQEVDEEYDVIWDDAESQLEVE